ncbi:hypothetical protein SDC9_157668 [bioreactor metagenome]|uniref:Uncharacterized protein n=1 Tax=bioreactor metagenome TaxID=1076179 RepID=A0A645FDB7_9ZZZZ
MSFSVIYRIFHGVNFMRSNAHPSLLVLLNFDEFKLLIKESKMCYFFVVRSFDSRVIVNKTFVGEIVIISECPFLIFSRNDLNIFIVRIIKIFTNI